MGIEEKISSNEQLPYFLYDYILYGGVSLWY